jgi:hypothetical protein
MLFETEARWKERHGLTSFLFFKPWENILKLLVFFLNEHKEKAWAPRTNTRHLNLSFWQSYSLYQRMWHALNKIGEGKGGEPGPGHL